MLKLIGIYSIGLLLLAISANSSIAQPFSNESKPKTIQEQLLDQIVAIVNNEIITRSEFHHALDYEKQQLIQNHIFIPSEKVFQKQVINQLIYQKLQLQLAKRNKIEVTKKEIDAAIARIAAQNRLSPSALKENLTQRGFSFQEFNNQIKQQLLISKIQQQAVASSISVNKSDIIDFEKQHKEQITSTRYHVATILIPMPECATINPAQISYAKDKAFLVLRQLQKGLSFESAMSTHPGSRDLGWWSISNFPQVFMNPISKMRLHEVIGPIQAPNGFHLIKLLGKENLNIINKQQLQQAVYQQKFEKALQQWLEQLRHSSYIRICINF